ncbi:MAG: PAS domain S-box protein [Gammaproteobacteria bacterium]|jgi:PAS domain S-box-containing protein
MTDHKLLDGALCAALQLIDEAVIALDDGLCISYVNPAFEKLFGYPARGILGNHVSMLWPESELEVAQTIRSSLQRDGAWYGETLRRHQNGDLVPVKINAARFTGHDEDPAVYVASLIDLRTSDQERKRTKTFLQVIEDLSTKLDSESLYDKAMQTAIELTGCDVGALALVEPDQRNVRYRWVHGLSKEKKAHMEELKVSVESGAGGMAMRMGNTQIIDDYAAFELAVPSFVKDGIRSLVAVPIPVGNEMRGAMIVASLGEVKPFDRTHQPLVEAIARQIGMALHRQRLMYDVRESGTYLKELVDSTPGLIVRMTPSGELLFINQYIKTLTGYDPHEVIGHNVWELFYRDQSIDQVLKIKRLISKGDIHDYAMDLKARSGVTYTLSLSSFNRYDENGKLVEIRGIGVDITDRIRSETALREREELISNLIENIPFAVFWKDRDSVIWGCNKKFAQQMGLEASQDIVGKTDFDLELDPAVNERHRLEDMEIMESGEPRLDMEEVLTDSDGGQHVALISKVPLRDDYGIVIGLLVIFADITERKKVEESVRRMNRSLLAISRCNQTLIHAADEQGLLDEICRLIVDEASYKMAWVGYAEEDPKKPIRIVSYAGAGSGYIDNITVSWDAASPYGNGPAGKVVRDGELIALSNIAIEPTFQPWRDMALANGFNSLLVLPLKRDEKTFGVLAIYSAQTDAFDAEEITLLQELADDLAYGIRSLRTRAEREIANARRHESERALQDSLVQTIQAIAMTVEKRDPYTAGHQQRVSELVARIGADMGLDQSKIDGLRLGAMIHDIGKIYIPSEILNRPGRLTQAEFDLIKSHPDVGYDIIKDVKFPWPVAAMIREHHERLDGSGYPDGLTGDQITLEARILAVADVIEAITSHRPYRPGLGLAMARDEITKNRGTKYDARVVDSALKVLDEGYIPEQSSVESMM